MRTQTSKLDKKHPEAARDTMDDIKDIGDPRPCRTNQYACESRPRARRSRPDGRHFDEGAGEARRRHEPTDSTVRSRF